jgi:hypothetical protein
MLAVRNARENRASIPRLPILPLTLSRPKEKKWPNGYPGDTAETFPLSERRFRNIRQRVRWQCHTCQTFFLDEQRECGQCQHQRCDDCTRIPPKKVKKEPDPAVVQSLEEKLSRMQISAAA